jgi:hypothetical protein
MNETTTRGRVADPAADRPAGEPRTAFVLAGGAELGVMRAGMVHGRRDYLIPDRAPRRLAARHLQFERLEQAAIPLHLVAFDLPTGTEARLSDGPLADALLATAVRAALAARAPGSPSAGMVPAEMRRHPR